MRIQGLRGFSLIEIMIAVLVVTLGIMPVYYLLTSGTRGVSVSLREIQAVNHAASLMEFLKGMGILKLKSQIQDSVSLVQNGWVLYDREKHEMVQHPEKTGQWGVDSEGSGSGVPPIFSTELAPVEPKSRSGLPVMEAYFQRHVQIRCQQRACIITVIVKWETETGKEDVPQRSFELRTVVVD